MTGVYEWANGLVYVGHLTNTAGDGETIMNCCNPIARIDHANLVILLEHPVTSESVTKLKLNPQDVQCNPDSAFCIMRKELSLATISSHHVLLFEKNDLNTFVALLEEKFKEYIDLY